MPLMAQASILDFFPAAPAGSPAPLQDKQALLEGKFELAKVRILGVPTNTVASPVQLGDQRGIEASLRARVIEGNLRALYDPNQLCSFGERLSEWVLDSLLQSDAHVCTAGQRYGLDRSGTPLTLEVIRDGSGPYGLAARLPGREQPFPLLTVTRTDAEINGARELALAQAWRERLEGRLNHARRIYSPTQLARRVRLALMSELLLLLVSATLLLWRRLRQRTSRLHDELRTRGRSDRRAEIRLYAEQALSIGVRCGRCIAEVFRWRMGLNWAVGSHRFEPRDPATADAECRPGVPAHLGVCFGRGGFSRSVVAAVVRGAADWCACLSWLLPLPPSSQCCFSHAGAVG